MSVETADLFLGAALLARGARLDGLQVRNGNSRGRPEVSFCLTGQDLEQLVDEFRSGTLTVNAIKLQNAQNSLKDVLFDALRRGRERA